MAIWCGVVCRSLGRAWSGGRSGSGTELSPSHRMEAGDRLDNIMDASEHSSKDDDGEGKQEQGSRQ